MPTTDRDRVSRVAALRARVLQHVEAPYETAEELTRASLRNHQRVLSGDTSVPPTVVTVRLHGVGVPGHQVAIEHAVPVLDELQRAVRWLGHVVRRDLAETTFVPKRPKKGERNFTVADATRLFLQPQFGAGSLIFELVGPPTPEIEDIFEEGDAPSTLLDASVGRLLAVVDDASRDDGEAPDALTETVLGMGSRAASALGRIADSVVANDIDVDLTWASSAGRRRKSRLTRRGAQAIQNAVLQNQVQSRPVTLRGILATASTGPDLIRVEGIDDVDYRMHVSKDIGRTLGPLLNKPVVVEAEMTIRWRPAGNADRRFDVVAIGPDVSRPSGEE